MIGANRRPIAHSLLRTLRASPLAAAPEEGLGTVLVLTLAGLDAGLWLLGSPFGAQFAAILALAP
jgi:hypothetical protein